MKMLNYLTKIIFTSQIYVQYQSYAFLSYHIPIRVIIPLKPIILLLLLSLAIHIILRKLLRLSQALFQYLKPHSRRKVVELDLLSFVFKNLYHKPLAENISAFLVDSFYSTVRNNLNVKSFVFHQTTLLKTSSENPHLLLNIHFHQNSRLLQNSLFHIILRPAHH